MWRCPKRCRVPRACMFLTCQNITSMDIVRKSGHYVPITKMEFTKGRPCSWDRLGERNHLDKRSSLNSDGPYIQTNIPIVDSFPYYSSMITFSRHLAKSLRLCKFDVPCSTRILMDQMQRADLNRIPCRKHPTMDILACTITVVCPRFRPPVF